MPVQFPPSRRYSQDRFRHCQKRQPSGVRSYYARFRWQYLRHHFASRLVQRGEPLNTARDLLGHRTVQMSLRYAHLAPDQRREAVAKLNEKPILALSLRLPWSAFQPGWMCPIEPSTPAL
jgi:integrase